MVDTCAAEFASETPYYYGCFDGSNEVEETRDHKKIMVLGSGPIRIGQGIEFDYCSDHSVWAMKQEGYEDGYLDGEKAGYDSGRKEEKERGICGLIRSLRDLDVARDQIIQKLQDTYQLTETEMNDYLKKYW